MARDPLAIIRECSKDEASYQRLVQLFEEQKAGAEIERNLDEGLLRRILNSLFIYAGVLKPDGTVLEINQAAVEPVGLSRADVVGQPIDRTPWWVNSPTSQQRVRDAVQAAASGQRMRYKERVRFAERQSIMIDLMIAPIFDATGRVTHLLVSAVDISDYAALEDRFRKVFEVSPNSISISTIDGGHFVDVNEHFLKSLGYSREEVIGKSAVELGLWVDSHAREQFVNGLRAHGEVRVFEADFRGKNGDVRTCLASAAVMMLNNQLHLLIITHDISSRKQLELEREALIMELDAFTRTVAHDLKDPLNMIIGYASLLANAADLSDKHREWADTISRSGYHLSVVVEELLRLAAVRHVGELHMEPVDMRQVVDDVLMRRLRHLIEEYRAEIILPDSWPSITSYGPWIGEVWANYISNAIKHGGRPPRVELSSRRGPFGGLQFRVQDNGAGISPDAQDKLFEEFTRLETAEPNGHGLGLSIVKRIIDRLGGQVGVESTPGQGSLFWFSFPPPR